MPLKTKTTLQSADLRIRKAVMNDCQDLWQWRNESRTRKQSLQTRKIPLREHTKWFQEAIRDKRRSIYVAIRNQSKLGVVRFDPSGERVLQVSINVNPEFRNKGLGRKLLKTTSDLIKRKHPDYVQKAVIKRANHPSEKIFSSAQFVKLHENPAYSLWVRP